MAQLLEQVDHLVYPTPDLNQGIDAIEQLLGVRAAFGGRHLGRGTHNALLALGPATYLEIIAPDPQQSEPKRPRPFGLEGPVQSRLATWAAKGHDLERLAQEASGKGVQLGSLTAGGRQRPDGVALSWQYTDPRAVLADGLVPFFIDWGNSPHPSATAPQGASLVALRGVHPEPKRVQTLLAQLGLDLPVEAGSAPALIALIDGPNGRVELR